MSHRSPYYPRYESIGKVREKEFEEKELEVTQSKVGHAKRMKKLMHNMTN